MNGLFWEVHTNKDQVVWAADDFVERHRFGTVWDAFGRGSRGAGGGAHIFLSFPTRLPFCTVSCTMHGIHRVALQAGAPCRGMSRLLLRRAVILLPLDKSL